MDEFGPFPPSDFDFIFIFYFLFTLFSRQCTQCDSSSSEDEDAKPDPNDNTPLLASRQKRNIKEPSKYTPGKDVSVDH